MHQFTFPILGFDNYDGDSFDLKLDVGFHLFAFRQCRLEGADTPELRDRRPAWKAAGYLAKRFAHEFIARGVADGAAYFVSQTYTGKYGRPLGDIIVAGVSLREELIRQRLAVPYHGQAKSAIEAEHQLNIDALIEQGKIAE